MAFQLKTEPGSPPGFTSTTHRNYQEMSISGLVSELRSAYEVEHYDGVEVELVKRDAKLKSDIGSLHEKIREERRLRTETEEKLKKREEYFEKEKRTKDSYEKLLKAVKQKGSLQQNIVQELTQKNLALERENRELRELKRKWTEDSNAVAELRIRIGELEKAGDKSALDALRMKNSKLEAVVEKNLKIQQELRTENCKLTDEKRRNEAMIESLERKFGELSLRVAKLEDDTKLLMSEDASGGGSTEVKPQDKHEATYVVNDEEDFRDYGLENDTVGHVPFQKNVHDSLGVATAQSRSKGNKDALSARKRFILENVNEIIDLDEDDDDDDDRLGCSSQGFHGKKSISQIITENEHTGSSNAVQHKRKCLHDYYTNTSTSDNHPLSFRAIACEKRSKTLAHTTDRD